jgi:iron complex outermembrane receptor protein
MDRRRVLASLSVLLACVAAASSRAEGSSAPDAQPTTPLPEVVVSATRSPGSLLHAEEFPGNATVITTEMIRRSGASTLPELLRGFEGITTMDTHGFGLGSDASVNLRGIINSSRTGALVLVNGVRQNRPTGDEVHWQGIPLRQVERIEVIRGGGGLGYGQGALSGVINIVLKQGAESPLETEQTAEWGTFGQRALAAAARGRSGPLSYGASAERRDVSGYRESTGSRTVTTTQDLALDPRPNVHLEARVLHSEDTSYFSGGITPEASQARRRQIGSFPGFFDDETTQVSGEARVSGLAGFSCALSAFGRFRETDSVTSGSRFAIIAPSKGLTLRLSHDADLGAVRHGLVGSLDLLDEKSSVGNRGGKLDESNKASYGLWLEDTIRLMDRVTLMAGARYDKSRFEEDISFPAFLGTLRFQGWSPTVGISADAAPGLTLYARFARPFKAPDVDDFSAVVTTPFVGNINLQPQQADEYEVGLRWRHERVGRAHAAWFYNRIDDEILFNASAFQNQNLDTERIGVEASLEPASPLPQVSGRLTYTFLEAEFRKGGFRGNAIPGVPEHRVTAHLACEPVPKLTLTLDWLLVQDFFRVNDFNNRLPGDNYGVLDLGVRFAHAPIEVYAKVLNVTSEEYTSFQSSNGTVISTGENPAPPTTWLLGVTVRF